MRVSAAQALAYQNQLQQPTDHIEVFTERRGGLCYNIKELFNYRPATQDQLRAFLFSDAERFSVFLKHEFKPSAASKSSKSKQEELKVNEVKTLGGPNVSSIQVQRTLRGSDE